MWQKGLAQKSVEINRTIKIYRTDENPFLCGIILMLRYFCIMLLKFYL